MRYLILILTGLVIGAALARFTDLAAAVAFWAVLAFLIYSAIVSIAKRRQERARKAVLPMIARLGRVHAKGIGDHIRIDTGITIGTSTLFGELRRLEDAGKVGSEWQPPQGYPRFRVYHAIGPVRGEIL